jgi:hypothetical protein
MESGSFMAGKSEFHGRKVGETRLGTQTGINNNEKCNFISQQRYVVAA